MIDACSEISSRITSFPNYDDFVAGLLASEKLKSGEILKSLGWSTYTQEEFERVKLNDSWN